MSDTRLVHGLDVEYGLAAIHCVELALHRAQHGKRVAGSAHRQAHSGEKAVLVLADVAEHPRLRFRAQVIGANAADHPHDGPMGSVIAAECDALAQRVFAGENLSSEGLVYHHIVRLLFRDVDQASAAQRIPMV